MILSEQTIRERVESGELGVDPELEPSQYQPASLDIRLGNEIYDVFTDDRFMVDSRLVVRPGDRLLGHTYERFSFPADVAGQVTGRSSLGRLFMTVHQTAGWIDPGFEGQVTLEIANFSNSVVELQPGQRVGQIVFFQVDRPTDGYDGQYQGDSGAQPSGEL